MDLEGGYFEEKRKEFVGSGHCGHSIRTRFWFSIAVAPEVAAGICFNVVLVGKRI